MYGYYCYGCVCVEKLEQQKQGGIIALAMFNRIVPFYPL